MIEEQTAVEWLVSELNRRGPKEDNPPQWLKELYEQAKEMEKQQIINAYWDGGEDMPMISKQCEQYYNEKFEA